MLSKNAKEVFGSSCYAGTGDGDQEDGSNRKQGSMHHPGQAADPAKEAEEQDIRCQFKGHFHVHSDQVDALPNENGRSHGYHHQSKTVCVCVPELIIDLVKVNFKYHQPLF